MWAYCEIAARRYKSQDHERSHDRISTLGSERASVRLYSPRRVQEPV